MRNRMRNLLPPEKARSPFVLALLRGDHQLHETKLTDALGATQVPPAQPEEIRELLGANAGSLGAIGAMNKARSAGHELLIIIDKALDGRYNMTTGANKDDYHLRGVDVERDLLGAIDAYADLRTVVSNEWCPTA